MKKGLASLSAFLLLVLAASAQAGGTLEAGPAQGDAFICNVVNVGPVTQSIRVDIINSFNGTSTAPERPRTVVRLAPWISRNGQLRPLSETYET